MQERPRLKKREIVLAVALGLMGATGAAIMLEAMEDDGGRSGEAGEIGGPGEMTYSVGSFDGISTEGPQDVEVTYGPEFSVRSEGSPEALALLGVVVENGRLMIRPSKEFNGDWGRLDDATIYVTMPRIDGITLAGSGNIEVDRIEGDSFEATAGGPGSISIGQLQVDRARLTVAGNGELVAAGTARDTYVNVSGDGEVQADGLRSETAKVDIGGTGEVSLTADRTALISITGTGEVDISGSAQCSVTRMGNGEVRCAGGGGTP